MHCLTSKKYFLNSVQLDILFGHSFHNLFVAYTHHLYITVVLLSRGYFGCLIGDQKIDTSKTDSDNLFISVKMVYRL